jgi:hypothetical protein
LFLLVALWILIFGSHRTPTAASGEAKPRIKILADEPRLILLTGGGQLTKPAEVQRFKDLLQKHHQNKSPHHVEAVDIATKKAGNRAELWAGAVGPAIARAKTKKLPIVVLAQFPPLVVKPSAEMLVRHEKDTDRTKAYGDLFADYARRLREQGADLVILGMEGAVGPDKSDPKAAGTYAHLWRVSDDVAGRKLPGVAIGPRLFETFNKHRHLYTGNDHHITAAGKTLVTHLWYQSLCNLDGIPVPEWSMTAVANPLKK